ncbi:hypothetical protein HCN44_001483 [Aphidius gifuensis]|uniref:Vitellogenin domain-containing protein n=2 Tax=Aphidius gifuensis TaxID=684658 RepID=A0A834XRK8_APHGI|nr:hypothetical protein HCN44_001483 [Aphidius gifuensis]
MNSPDIIKSTNQLKIIFVTIIFLIIVSVTSTKEIFRSHKTYVYSYLAESSSGVLLPSRAASTWGFKGKLFVKTTNSSAVYFQLKSLKTFVNNGKLGETSGEMNVDEEEAAVELGKPFEIIYKNGLVMNFSVEINSSIWANNIKRSIAGILQLDLTSLEDQVAFYSPESNHYGRCTSEYITSPESVDEKWIRKFLNPRACVGHPHWAWTNVPRMQCPTSNENPIIKSSERLYKIKSIDNSNEITFVNATGEIYVQPFQSFGEAQFLFTRQVIELIEVTDLIDYKIDNKFVDVAIQHQLPDDDDLSQGRAVHKKEEIFKSISLLLDRLSQRLENPGLDTEIENLHNTTVSILLYYLGKLDRSGLQAGYNSISGTSYKEETIRNMFLETLPQIGTRDAALFILDLIQQKKVSDITAMQLLTQLPFHIRRPDVQLLVSLQPLLNLPDKISSEVRNTGILTFGTLIYKTCLVYCPYEMLDDYVRLYLDKFTENKLYEMKMVWLEGLSNIQLGRVVEFLEPIASGNSLESRHLRVLAAWASLPTAALRPDVIYPVYWPILINRTEHLEMRVAALTLLIISNPTANRIISLYWYMHSEPNDHLYNFFYTTLKSMERTNFPCYKHIGEIAAQFSRILRKPTDEQPIATGNYIFDYEDTTRNFGAMIQSIIIASPKSNIPEVAYITLNSHGSGTNLNHISIYIKATGLMQSLSSYLESPVRVKDILKQFKIDKLTSQNIHFEIIARVQQKAVLCLHFNSTNIANAMSYLTSLPDNTFHIYKNMEFHVNQQRINVPLTMESIQVTDLGTNVRLAATTTSLFSLRGNFTHFSGGRNNHMIVRTAVHGTEVVESYNPLIDVWHSAERAQSLHGYLPANITVGLQDKLFISYNTPGEYLRTGITFHTRTTTTIRGVKVNQKLRKICSNCSLTFTVKRSNENTMKEKIIFDWIVPELGGHFNLKIFDCETQVTQDEILSDIGFSHRGNYQSWPLAKWPLLAAHLFDYFSYVPPKGSCGLAVYIDPSNIQPSEVKFEFIKNGKFHVFSLTRSVLETSEIIQQWTLAAVYESTSWLSDSLKIKATKTQPGEKVMKVCIEMEKIIPWTWDDLSLKTSDPASIKLNVIWGWSDQSKGKCNGTSLLMNFVGEVSEQQIQESKSNKWPYKQCRQESIGKSVLPYTESCYEASKELSTLRKYQIVVISENLPERLSQILWRLKSLYDVIGGGNNTALVDDNQLVVSAIFAKDYSTSTMHVNHNEVPIRYDPEFVDTILMRTRLHRYIDNPMLRVFFSVCTLTPSTIRSAYNVTKNVEDDKEFLVLGQCYDDNPGFALTSYKNNSGLTLVINDESDNIKIVPDKMGGSIYNFNDKITIERDFNWTFINGKRIRLDEKSIYLFLNNIFLFIHFTEEQILLFFPNYIKEFTCGVCTARTFNSNIYHKV